MSLKNKLKDYIILFIPFAFYVFFAFFDGYVLCDDSNTYINMGTIVEPLYPSFVAIIRLIVGKNNNYLFIVILIQSILLAYATSNIVNFIKKEFNTNIIFESLVIFIFLSVSLLCRFVAKRGSMYSNCILTEGITYPLFLLFFRYNMDYLINKNKKELMISTIILALLICTRKQMYYALVLELITIIIVNKTFKSWLTKILVVLIIVFGSSKLMNIAYMQATQGIASDTTSDNRFLMTMVYYSSEKEYKNEIKDADAKELYGLVYDACDKKGLLKHSVKEKWFDRVVTFGDYYDYIQIDTMGVINRQFVKDKYGLIGAVANQKIDELNEIIIKSLIVKTLPSILSTIKDNILEGLMISVSAEREIFIVYAIIIYILFIGLLIYEKKKNGKNKLYLFCLMSLLANIINVVMVSTLIFCQTRYTFYNMALFYISGLLLLINFLKSKNVQKYI